jgi:ubiquinone/menaquinone biosynthesis C-methylase UbiE
MGSGSIYKGFSDVDGSEEPEHFVDCLYEQYSKDSAHQFNKQRILEWVDLQNGQTVLDAGCGIGFDAIQMSMQVGETGHVYGVDISQEMIEKAKSNAAHLELPLTFGKGNLYKLDFDGDFFDCCRVDHTFQHLSDPMTALIELIRVTKPGGKIIITDPDHDSLIIDTPFTDVNNRFIRFRSDHMPQGGIAHQMYGRFKEIGLIGIQVKPLTHVYTDYEEKKITSPYLDEIWIAQEYGAVTREEAESWALFLREAINEDRFLCMLTYIITIGVKPEVMQNAA